MSNSPTVVYRARPDTTPEAELSALTAVYKFILDCASKRDRSSTSSPGDTAIVRNKKEVTV